MPINITKTSFVGGLKLTSTGIITDGLVAYYNPTFPTSYPGSGTSLFDLSGNGLTAAVSGGAALVTTGNVKALSFDGSNDYAQLTPTPSVLQGDARFTICGWFKRTASLSQKLLWMIGANTTNPQQAITTYVPTSTELITITTYNNIISTGVTYPLNEWVFCAWQKQPGLFNRTNITIWRNLVSYTGAGLTLTLGVETNPVNLASTGISFGAGTLGISFTSIDVGLFMVYNKFLTSDEITRTYNATKTYVGL